MTEPKTKIKLIEDKRHRRIAAVREWRAKSGRQQMPGILKCFSHRLIFCVMKFSDTVHFRGSFDLQD